MGKGLRPSVRKTSVGPHWGPKRQTQSAAMDDCEGVSLWVRLVVPSTL